MAQWEVVIGLETHVQLTTQSKIFSGSSTAFGAEPNTQASIVDLALPGALPVMNRGAVERAVKFGLAIGAKINQRSIMARKNYFYPDLPKGYQISQYETPIVQGGHVVITLDDGATKTIELTRAHLEEDAGKSVHDLVDAGLAVEQIVHAFAGIFFEMRSRQFNELGGAVVERDRETTTLHDGRLELRDLITLGQIRVEVVFARHD